jgi:Tfp pilus assembly protein PilN
MKTMLKCALCDFITNTEFSQSQAEAVILEHQKKRHSAKLKEISRFNNALDAQIEQLERLYQVVFDGFLRMDLEEIQRLMKINRNRKAMRF